MNPKTKAQIEIAGIALLAILFLWISLPDSAPKKAQQPQGEQAVLFPAVSIEAKSAIVYDAKEGKALFEKDPDETLPLASLTKLMTALAASELVPNYLLVRLTPNDIRQEGDNGLLVDEEWTVRKLVDYSLLVSSNDGASAIASVAGSQLLLPRATSTDPLALFIERMNDTARRLGLSHMRFANVSGLDISKTASGGYGSAREIALLVDHIVRNDPHILEATSLIQATIDSKTEAHVAGNTNKAIGHIPNVIASKTGYTDLSGGNLVVAWNAGLDHPIIISVLGSSYDGRFSDMETLVRSTLQYLASTTSSVSVPQI